MSVIKPKNTAAAVKEKLLNIARKSGRLFDALLLQYMQERFLYQLSVSQYFQNFILKGAMLFLTYGINEGRPTKDIDFLARSTGNNVTNVRKILTEIIEIQCNDGVTFDAEKLKFEEIDKDGKYSGLRVTFEASLAQAKKALQIDIGFDDIITDGPILVDFPIILPQNPVPKIYSYSLSSAIAEKLEAIVKLSYANSWMKDFYDILFFAEHNSFEFETLKDAIINTFQNRKTPLINMQTIFCDRFINAPENDKKWKTFVTRNNFTINDNFCEIMNKIINFIKPLFNTKSKNTLKSWNHESFFWI